MLQNNILKLLSYFFFNDQVRRRRPDTRLNLQYDKLYVNNVAYWYNDDTEEIELVHQEQESGDTLQDTVRTARLFCKVRRCILRTFAHLQTVMKGAVRLKKRDLTPSRRRKNFISKSYSSGEEFR